MNIETTRFGVIEIEEGKIITMPYGMPGFPQSQRFVLIPHKQDSPFFWYQSVDDPALAFVVVNPSVFVSGYAVDLQQTIQQMCWEVPENEDPFEVYVVVTIPRGSPEHMTANLLGPIVIHNGTRQAVQMVLSESSYPHRFPVFSGLSAS